MPWHLLDRKPFDPAVFTLTPSLMKKKFETLLKANKQQETLKLIYILLN